MVIFHHHGDETMEEYKPVDEDEWDPVHYEAVESGVYSGMNFNPVFSLKAAGLNYPCCCSRGRRA